MTHDPLAWKDEKAIRRAELRLRQEMERGATMWMRGSNPTRADVRRLEKAIKDMERLTKKPVERGW